MSADKSLAVTVFAGLARVEHEAIKEQQLDDVEEQARGTADKQKAFCATIT